MYLYDHCEYEEDRTLQSHVQEHNANARSMDGEEIVNIADIVHCTGPVHVETVKRLNAKSVYM